MVLDSQVQTPSGCRFKMRLPLERSTYAPCFLQAAPPTHQTKASSHTNTTSDAPAIAIGAHWSRRTRVITTKPLTQ